MIKIKYKALFDIEFEHSFYQSGKSADLLLVPTRDCQMLLNTLGLRFIAGEYGGALFTKVNTVDNKDVIHNALRNGTRFSFLIKLKLSTFENISQLNLIKPRTSKYYFNNLVDNLSATSEPLLVANTTSKIVSDSDILPFVSNSLSYVHTNTAASQNAELRFIDNDEVLQQQLANSNNIFNYSFDLNKASTGRAKLFVEGAEKASIYSINPADVADTFGMVEIFYKNDLPTTYQFQNNDNSIDTKHYKIAFANRLTKWRYIVTKRFNQTVTGVKIAKANGTPIAFSVGAGAPPGVFIVASNNMLPLKEAPVTGIKLTDQSDNLIIANLPNPPLHLIKTEGADTFSDIFITI
ncbi:hypothetical protein IM792_19355 [Mucilaginibacter sp. JRF]|uniref:hypothetical protein n=1 Tax=Mucilaginibacter sp. JRF TaxID=2780088 RepID=UPI001880AB21|nr:hypothetical protein [Mucilaginibacter sp. JRF]MBE9586615.1 hypothetical protein [Mucilaginibacter sp. JRF]